MSDKVAATYHPHNSPTWSLRCYICGDYASGHGQAPCVRLPFTCGDCLNLLEMQG